MSQSPLPTINRRTAFLGAGTVGALAAAAAALPRAEAPVAVATNAPAEPEAKSGYQLTDHVKQYYATARI
jgi:threonine dehydrogenase-like Zn-dependent dehydrogenase